MAEAAFTSTELYLMHEIVIRLDRLSRGLVLDSLGIGYPEFLVMMAVRELKSPTQEAVGNHVDLSSSLVSQRVSTLRRKRLLTQTQNPRNRRMVTLALTTGGNTILDSAYSAMISSTDKLFNVTGPDRPAFRRSLEAIAAALRVHEAGSSPSRRRAPPRGT